MTVIVVLAEPPQSRLVLSEPAETNPLSKAETADLYAAMLKDVCIAIEQSGGDLLVSYRTEDELPDEFAGGHDSEAEIRSVVADALDGTNNARFEPQISSMFSACAGNTVSHLLNEEEEVHSVAIVRPIAPLLGHAHLDSATMELRGAPVVLGPSMEGRVYFPDFLDPVDFTDAYAEPEVETLTRHTDSAGHGLDYIPMLLVLKTGAGPTTVVPVLRSRVESERLVPECTTTFVFEEGFRVEPADGVLGLVRD